MSTSTGVSRCNRLRGEVRPGCHETSPVHDCSVRRAVRAPFLSRGSGQRSFREFPSCPVAQDGRCRSDRLVRHASSQHRQWIARTATSAFALERRRAALFWLEHRMQAGPLGSCDRNGEQSRLPAPSTQDRSLDANASARLSEPCDLAFGCTSSHTQAVVLCSSLDISFGTRASLRLSTAYQRSLLTREEERKIWEA